VGKSTHLISTTKPYYTPPRKNVKPQGAKLNVPSHLPIPSLTIHLFTITTPSSTLSLISISHLLHHRRTPPSHPLAQKRLGRDVIRRRISKATSTVPGLCDDGAGALARVEATAALLAIRIRRARSGNELCARRNSSPGSGCVAGGSCCLAQERFRCDVIRSRVSKATSTVPGLCDDGAGAFACVEATAALLAICV
jgi:hypothetical protein